MLTYSVVGSARTVTHGLQQFMEKTQVDEVMIASHIYDPQVRLRAYEIIAEMMRG